MKEGDARRQKGRWRGREGVNEGGRREMGVGEAGAESMESRGMAKCHPKEWAKFSTPLRGAWPVGLIRNTLWSHPIQVLSMILVGGIGKVIKLAISPLNDPTAVKGKITWGKGHFKKNGLQGRVKSRGALLQGRGMACTEHSTSQTWMVPNAW